MPAASWPISGRAGRASPRPEDLPFRLWAVLDESVLHHVAGSPDIMREQLEHLNRLSTQPPPERARCIWNGSPATCTRRDDPTYSTTAPCTSTSRPRH
ncbi:Scr1 family TA system antitoxin-like transcriptional regulator [Streptomyces sp. NPDC002073]